MYMKAGTLWDKGSILSGLVQLLSALPKHTKLHGHQQNSPGHFGYKNIIQIVGWLKIIMMVDY